MSAVRPNIKEARMKPKVTNTATGSGFRVLSYVVGVVLAAVAVLPLQAQVVTVTVQGRVYDTTGAAISQATVTVVNAATGLARSAMATAVGDYQITALPVGDYTVTAEKSGFQKQAKKVRLDIGAAAN